MEQLMGKVFRKSRKRIIATALAFLMICSMVPMVWTAVSAAGAECGLEEHAHTDECYKLTCALTEGDQYGTHAHDESCFARKLICECAEGTEHTDECYVSEKACTLEEGDNVLLGQHFHAQDCYTLICERSEHAHTETCEISAEKSSESKIMLLAGSTDLSVSGVWDIGATEQGHENIPFGSSASATISHDANHASEQVNVRISVSFPENASNLKLKIHLKPGLVWLVNGENTIPKTTLDSVSSLQDETTFIKPLGNGAYIYEFKDGVTSVTVDIVVEKSFLTNFPSISDAITAEVSCTQNGAEVTERTSLTTLLPQQFSSNTVLRSKLSVRTKAGKQTSVRNGLRVGSYLTSAVLKDRYRLYEYIQFTINAPSGAIYVGVDKEDTAEGSPNQKWQMVGEPEVLGDGTTNYTFRGEDIYSMYYSSSHLWIFPESLIGQDVKITTTDFRWKVYGDTEEQTVPSDVVGTATITVVDPNVRDEKTEISDVHSSHSLVPYDEDAPDAIYRLTAWSMRNTGTDPSSPKIIELEFDTEKIGVAGVTLITPYNKKPTTVWFKVEGSDEWQQKNISLPTYFTNGSAFSYHTLVRNIDLGLDKDTYLSAIKYELDYVDNNGTPADTSDDFHYGIPAGESSIGDLGSIYAPIIGVVKEAFHEDTSTVYSTARAYDKVEEGEEIPHDTGKVKIRTRYSTNLLNYLGTVNNDIIKAEAGDTLTFTTTIKSYWSTMTDKEYIVGFHPYPVIYIRDETGEGISNVKLTNGLGVELLSEYPGVVTLTLDHIETTDHNGDGKFAKVYKIDTTDLKNMESFEDRYAACIGACDLSGNKRPMTLTYSVVTSNAYNDSQTVHYTENAVYVTDEDMANRTRRNQRNEMADEFDVDGDGLTDTDKSIVAPSSGYSPGYYIISARSDISVSAAIKKMHGSDDYATWDGSSSYIQIEPRETYSIRNSVLNGSGVRTSEEEGKMTYIYIPIPKKGQQWGQANSGIDKAGNTLSTFAYDMKLTEEIRNPDASVFTISYGTVDTSAFSAGDSYGTVGQSIKNSPVAWSSSISDSTNCVRIAVKGMAPSEIADNFILSLKSAEDADNRAVNIFSSIYYEDITNINGNRFAGWYASDRLALQIAEGEVSGRLWEDLNGNGIQDEGEPGMKDMTVTLVGDLSFTNPITTTDENGEYRFTKLPICDYYVFFSPEYDDYFISEKNVGSNTKIDSDAVAIPGSDDQHYVGAHIEGINIPYTDSLGRQNYVYENMDAGFVPYINVGYAWEVDSVYDAPADAEFPVTTGKILAGTAYTAGVVTPFEGYTFDGWYTDYGFSRKYVDGTVLTEDITLRGRWSANPSTITFDANGGSDVAPIVSRYTYPVTAPADPVREGYTFKGWDKEIPAAMPLNDITITAQWEINQYTITFDTDGGTAIAPITQDYGTAVTAPADPTRAGYTFKGWDMEIPAAMPAEDMTVTAQWEANRYTITFNTDGGTEIAPIAQNYGTAVTAPENPAKTGYTFKGWDKVIPDTMPDEDMTITAQWEINQYTITFDTDGGTAIAPITQDYGTAVIAPADPTRTGYTFKGWDIEIPAAMPAEDVTITAQWDINKYSVDYNVVGTKPVKAVVPENDIVDYNTAYTAEIPAAVNGYTFDGWYTDDSCTTRFADGTAITEHTDLYGKWSRNLVTVSGAKTWAENGEGFVRPDSVTIDLYRSGTMLDSVEIAKDESTNVQTYSFEGLYETDEEGNAYVYTVKERTTPDKYVSVVSGYDVTNTYNVDRFIISKNWNNTGNPDELPESVDVEFYCDGTLCKTVTLTGESGWSKTVTIPSVDAEGHSFTIKEIAVPGFSTAYEAPASKDTDGDGIVDTMTYVINNTYIMPEITVSGEIAWDKIPNGMTEPEIKVNLMVGDKVIDTVTIPAGICEYSFDGLDRYDDEGNVLAYTVEVDDIGNYDVVITAPTTDADGNIDIDVTATGTFAYGTLTVSNKVSGKDVPAETVFTYTVTFDSKVKYPYTGSASGTIKSGSKITLKAGESITISDILTGVKFTVEQEAIENFVTAPSSGKIEGVISSSASVAEFTNKFELPPVGNLEITNKVTGDIADRTLKFPFKVEFDAEGSYELRIFGAGENVSVNTTGMLGGITVNAAAGSRATITTIKSGDTIQLAHGETAVIYSLPAGTSYKVTETDTKGYKLTSTGATGTIAEDGSKASFINEKNDKVAGGTAGPDTGDHGTTESAALVVMQIAVLAMLLCIICMKKLRQEDEAWQL